MIYDSGIIADHLERMINFSVMELRQLDSYSYNTQKIQVDYKRQKEKKQDCLCDLRIGFFGFFNKTVFIRKEK